MIHKKPKGQRRRNNGSGLVGFVFGITVLALGLLTACGSAYHGQVAVPNTKQRLVVGNDNWPNKRIWVIEGDKVEDVNIVKEERK